jgi:hypothetical protein
MAIRCAHSAFATADSVSVREYYSAELEVHVLAIYSLYC